MYQTIVTVIGVVALIMVISTLVGVMDIDLSEYGSYLFWMIALIIFFAVLPPQPSDILTKKI